MNARRYPCSAVDDMQTVAAVRTASGRGLRSCITAASCPHGLGEHWLGVAGRGSARDSYVLSTQAGMLLRPHAIAADAAALGAATLGARQHVAEAVS